MDSISTSSKKKQWIWMSDTFLTEGLNLCLKVYLTFKHLLSHKGELYCITELLCELKEIKEIVLQAAQS